MHGMQCLSYLWVLLFTQICFVCSDIHFLERHEGESVVLHCEVEQRNPVPFGVYLRRNWLHPGEVLFMFTNSAFQVDNNADKNRTSVSGDPSLHSLNITISQLKASDTDRYYCEFVYPNPSFADKRIRGKNEFFLLVGTGASGSVDIEVRETFTGDSVVLPCFPQNEEGLAVEGVSLKRQKGRAPVEVLYHSKWHHSSSYSSSSSEFPIERVQLSSVPGPGGITYNLTLQQLQPDDSALYSCQLLLRGRINNRSSLGSRVFFVSVQGGQCDFSSYSSLLYALSSAVITLPLLLLIGFVIICKGKALCTVKSNSQATIYEEMVGGKPPRQNPAPCHLEEMELPQRNNPPQHHEPEHLSFPSHS